LSLKLFFFAVKTYDKDKTEKELSTIAIKETMIISFQNGIDNDREIEKHIQNGVVYPGAAYVAVEKTKAGLIEQAGGSRKFIFGDRKDPENRRLKEGEKLMREAGGGMPQSLPILPEIYGKSLCLSWPFPV
jgi:ketopantoate reductase